MSDVIAAIEAVFAEFEDASSREEWARFDGLFLPTFLSLDPATAAPLERQALIGFLPRRRGIFERAGASGTRLATLEVTQLDPIHALARTTWDVLFDRTHDPVTLRSTFLLRHTEDGWRIAVYLNHESLLQLLAPAAPSRADPGTRHNSTQPSQSQGTHNSAALTPSQCPQRDPAAGGAP